MTVNYNILNTEKKYIISGTIIYITFLVFLIINLRKLF